MKKLILAAALAITAVLVAPIATASADRLAGDRLVATCLIQGKATFGAGLGFGATVNTTYEFEKGLVNAESPAGVEAECEGAATKLNCKKEAAKTFKYKDANCTEVDSKTEGEYNLEEGETVFGNFTGANKWTVTKAEVRNGRGDLECGIKSKDGTGVGSDENFEKATATIEVEKGSPAKKFKASSYFYFKSTKAVGEIEANFNAKKGGGGNSATGFANFKEPGNEAKKIEVAEKCAKKEATELPFETAQLKPVVGGRAFGVWGTLGGEYGI